MDSTLDCYESEVAAVADLPRSAPPAFQIESMQLALAAIALSVDAACGRFGGKSARQRAVHGAAAAPHCTLFSLSSPAAHTQPHTRSPLIFQLRVNYSLIPYFQVTRQLHCHLRAMVNNAF